MNNMLKNYKVITIGKQHKRIKLQKITTMTAKINLLCGIILNKFAAV